MEIQIHPELRSLLFPLKEEELKLLEESILREGIREKLVVWEHNGKLFLVDGHHRLEIARKHGIPFQITKKNFRSLEEAKIWMLQNQLGRRNLTDEQRAYIQGKLYEMLKKPRGRPQKIGQNVQFFNSENATAENLGSLFGVNEKTVRRNSKFAEAVDRVKQINVKAAEKILRGEVKDAITALPQIIEKEKPEIVEEALKRLAERETGKLKLKKAVMEVKIQKLKEKAEKLDPPSGKYNVIVVDPPWPYSTEYDPDGHRGASPYPEMSLEEIKSLRLPMAENCIVWLWTTNAFMHEAFHVLEAWGLKPKTILTWVKDRMGVGSWLRGQTEHCILAVKGNPEIHLTNQSTVIFGKVREHSRKPEEFYQLVESLCIGRKLDYFGRKRREGWDVYGTEELEENA